MDYIIPIWNWSYESEVVTALELMQITLFLYGIGALIIVLLIFYSY